MERVLKQLCIFSDIDIWISYKHVNNFNSVWAIYKTLLKNKYQVSWKMLKYVFPDKIFVAPFINVVGATEQDF
jgi:hypothetical protein